MCSIKKYVSRFICDFLKLNVVSVSITFMYCFPQRPIHHFLRWDAKSELRWPTHNQCDAGREPRRVWLHVTHCRLPHHHTGKRSRTRPREELVSVDMCYLLLLMCYLLLLMCIHHTGKSWFWVDMCYFLLLMCITGESLVISGAKSGNTDWFQNNLGDL